ncbi:MAG: TVP38/TMEM64 family protein [Desulfurivibrio sp.]|nr:MAG: TVP38/TMEM64 family protein [Desulfurivibrio sp.]
MRTLILKVLFFMVVLAALFLLEFHLFGQDFELLFNQQRCIEWFSRIRPYGWAIGIGLLIGDLLLPVPATGIMAALGNVYGVMAGALFSVIGSAGAGFIGYGVARFLGSKGSRFLAAEEDLARFQRLFDKWGGMAIIISRMMPVLPEVLTILAGIAGMNLLKFTASLLLGTVFTSLLFSWLGYASRALPGYGMLAAVLIPLLIWPVFLRLVRGKQGR